MLVGTIEVKPEIRKKIQDLGCTVLELPSRRTNTLNYFVSLVKVIRKQKIDVVHAHGNSGTLAIEMLAAKLGGCRKRIAHSHNTQCDQVKADKLLRPLLNVTYTIALACGEDAGRWLFGSRPFQILKNGRDFNIYSYNAQTRERVRLEYNLGNSLTLGHVGGFFEQKNHRFISRIYHEIVKMQPTAKLFMIGDGPLKPEIEELCADIKDNVIFTGSIDNVQDLLQAMDVMILPSLFEGLPLVAVEWQINGLPCLLSDKVTRECAATEQVEFVPLEAGESVWAEKAIQAADGCERSANSRAAKENLKKLGFDIRDNTTKLQNIYCG
ncbi:MAG: glycosyltransferase family 1 protein [Oscillospiraceae bacterium]|nr:glycosyltransferase family 1 protein [Oscillospiraceae bacterium]